MANPLPRTCVPRRPWRNQFHPQRSRRDAGGAAPANPLIPLGSRNVYLGRSARQRSHRFEVGGHRARDRILPPGTGGMNTAVVRAPSAQTLLKLGRVSNLPTVWTNVIAGATIASTAATVADIATVGLAMTAFYVGGMYLNDFFDREIDARERPGRPIHTGDIGAAAVSTIGFALLAAGVAFLAPFGLFTVIWGLALAVAIVLYDAWHKGNRFAPVIMGLCRALVYLGTGAAVSGNVLPALIVAATALAAHVIGLTYAAKQENLNNIGRLWPLAVLAGPPR